MADTREAAKGYLRAWLADPVLFVRQVFGAEPDVWQAKVLMLLAAGASVAAIRIALSACKGPGKSCVLAWAAWWILLCHPGAQGLALSITEDNLRDGLWKELAYWRSRSALIQKAFDQTAQRISSVESPSTWWLHARSYAQSADAAAQANSLAGLHARHVFVLLDEVGDMPPGVVSAAHGIFAVEGQTGWLLAAGNPTSQDGALWWICTTDAARWQIVSITGDPDDPNRSPRISLDYARGEIAALGRDNPWVMVNILGKFPPSGARQLISTNDVLEAMSDRRDPPKLQVRGDAIVWGVDPARSERSGADEAALMRRQGVLVRSPLTWRGLDGTQLGDEIGRLLLVAEKEGEGPDQVFIDVGGIGASPYDRLKFLGFDDIVSPVDFGSVAASQRYADKRTEMWVSMAEWLKTQPAALPNDPVLRAELSAPRYDWRTRQRSTCFCLETKDEMSRRGVRSPNRADALALTFAAPVAPRRRDALSRALEDHTSHAKTEYDIWERA